ncbi:unnamed protein product [Mortierella alpina]
MTTTSCNTASSFPPPPAKPSTTCPSSSLSSPLLSPALFSLVHLSIESRAGSSGNIAPFFVMPSILGDTRSWTAVPSVPAIVHQTLESGVHHPLTVPRTVTEIGRVGSDCGRAAEAARSLVLVVGLRSPLSLPSFTRPKSLVSTVL